MSAADAEPSPHLHDHRDNRRTASPARQRGRSGARRLSRRIVSGPQTVEAYLRANTPPRYMRRLREIETEYRLQRRRLDEAYRALAEACADNASLFSYRWRLEARTWSFDRLNELIREHNAWYPIEADLPMDPRSRDYIPIRGQSYRRLELGPDWLLEHLPPAPPGAGGTPTLPARVPREPL